MVGRRLSSTACLGRQDHYPLTGEDVVAQKRRAVLTSAREFFCRSSQGQKLATAETGKRTATRSATTSNSLPNMAQPPRTFASRPAAFVALLYATRSPELRDVETGLSSGEALPADLTPPMATVKCQAVAGPIWPDGSGW
ncbi:hypothetical protein ACLK1T_04050 [Escherichia coli]